MENADHFVGARVDYPRGLNTEFKNIVITCMYFCMFGTYIHIKTGSGGRSGLLVSHEGGH